MNFLIAYFVAHVIIFIIRRMKVLFLGQEFTIKSPFKSFPLKIVRGLASEHFSESLIQYYGTRVKYCWVVYYTVALRNGNFYKTQLAGVSLWDALNTMCKAVRTFKTKDVH
jgi:hypothetical protein